MDLEAYIYIYIDDNYRSDRQTDILKVMMRRYLYRKIDHNRVSFSYFQTHEECDLIQILDDYDDLFFLKKRKILCLHYTYIDDE